MIIDFVIFTSQIEMFVIDGYGINGVIQIQMMNRCLA